MEKYDFHSAKWFPKPDLCKSMPLRTAKKHYTRNRNHNHTLLPIIRDISSICLITLSTQLGFQRPSIASTLQPAQRYQDRIAR